jgi:hypothetical protein
LAAAACAQLGSPSLRGSDEFFEPGREDADITCTLAVMANKPKAKPSAKAPMKKKVATKPVKAAAKKASSSASSWSAKAAKKSATKGTPVSKSSSSKGAKAGKANRAKAAVAKPVKVKAKVAKPAKVALAKAKPSPSRLAKTATGKAAKAAPAKAAKAAPAKAAKAAPAKAAKAAPAKAAPAKAAKAAPAKAAKAAPAKATKSAPVKAAKSSAKKSAPVLRTASPGELLAQMESNYDQPMPARYRQFLLSGEYQNYAKLEMSGYIRGPYNLNFVDPDLAHVAELGLKIGISDMDDVPWAEDYSAYVPLAMMWHPKLDEPKLFLVVEVSEDCPVLMFDYDGWKLYPIAPSLDQFLAALPKASNDITSSFRPGDTDVGARNKANDSDAEDGSDEEAAPELADSPAGNADLDEGSDDDEV